VSLRALLRGSLLYTLGNFLPRIGTFLLLPVYTAAMGPDQFGVLSLMLSLSALLAIVYRLGLDGALLRFHFDVSPARRPSLYRTVTAVTVVASLGLSVVFAALLAPFFDRIFPGVSFWPYGALALAFTATTALQYVPSDLFRAVERPGRFVAFALAVFAVAVAGVLLFVLVLDMGAAGGLLANLASGGVVIAAAGYVFLRMRRGRVERELASETLRFGLPLVPHGLAGWVLNLSDRWLIGLLMGVPAVAAQSAIGVYSFGYVFGQSVALVAMSFNAAWVPVWYARGDAEHGPALLREMTTLVMVALGILAVGVSVVAPELTRLLATRRWGAEAEVAATVIPIVAAASLVYGLYFMLVATVFLRRRTAGLPILTLVAGVANVGANVLLIPAIGVMGAAWSTLIGYGVLTALTWWYAARGFPVSIDLVRLAVIVAGGIAAVIVAQALNAPRGAGLTASAAAHVIVAVAYTLLLIPVAHGPVGRVRDLLSRPVTA
jgi:O-antigen/teichoic acid export membrane protein